MAGGPPPCHRYLGGNRRFHRAPESAAISNDSGGNVRDFAMQCGCADGYSVRVPLPLALPSLLTFRSHPKKSRWSTHSRTRSLTEFLPEFGDWSRGSYRAKSSPWGLLTSVVQSWQTSTT